MRTRRPEGRQKYTYQRKGWHHQKSRNRKIPRKSCLLKWQSNFRGERTWAIAIRPFYANQKFRSEFPCFSREKRPEFRRKRDLYEPLQTAMAPVLPFLITATTPSGPDHLDPPKRPIATKWLCKGGGLVFILMSSGCLAKGGIARIGLQIAR